MSFAHPCWPRGLSGLLLFHFLVRSVKSVWARSLQVNEGLSFGLVCVSVCLGSILFLLGWFCPGGKPLVSLGPARTEILL